MIRGWLHIIADGEGVQFVNNLTVNKEQRFPDIEFVDFEEKLGRRDQFHGLCRGRNFTRATGDIGEY